jgi:hypothetical protein
MWTSTAFPAPRCAPNMAGPRSRHGWTRSDRLRPPDRGCSASFVRTAGSHPHNHHCVAHCVEQNSTAENNILVTGYTARTREEENDVRGQQAEVVTSIRDVTTQVKAAIGNSTGRAPSRRARQSIAQLETDCCPDIAKTRCQVVSLYGGRSVQALQLPQIFGRPAGWAPEAQAAQFRRRSGQFQFPALLDGCELPARL